MKKKRIVVFIFFAVIFFVGIFFLIKKISQEFKSLDNDLADAQPSTFKLLANHANLISKDFRNKLSVNEILHDKFRNPIAFLYYENDYNLIVYQIQNDNDSIMNSIMHVQQKEAERTLGISYAVIGRDLFFKFNYRSGKVGKISQIFVNLYGDSLQLVYNSDSVISYHLLCKKLAVSYEVTGDPIDIFITGNDLPLGKSAIVPMDILFLQQQKDIYMLIMTPRKYKASIDADKLINIVIDKGQKP